MTVLLPPYAGFINTVHCADAIDFMAWLWRQGVMVDAIITDLPYGTTACSWDEIIPFEPMWAGIKRILKPRGVFVTTASQPFTSKLVMSNLDWFKYEWVWDKVASTGFMSAKFQPMKQTESICVFSQGGANNGSINSMSYYPQGIKQVNLVKKNGSTAGGKSLRDNGRVGKNNVLNINETYIQTAQGYPTNLITFQRDDDKLHPTQKPVALYEYLIRTYTQPGELVLDFCCGSGTTGVACVKTGRSYILCDTGREYVDISINRIHAGFVTIDVAEGMKQPSLFAGVAV